MSSPPQPPQGEAYTGVPGVGVPIQELIVRHSPSAACSDGNAVMRRTP